MEFKEMMSRGITSSILTAEDETFLDKDGNIVSVEKFVPVGQAINPRELAEILLPDMTTVPMTDDEIKRFMES